MTTYKSGMRIGEYLLEEQIGGGTFGEVWRARHHVWENEHVAVKLPTEPEYVRYLQREGVVIHGLKHENIVRVLGFDPYAEHPYLVMELVDGPSLREVIDDHPRGLPLPVVQAVFRGILLGLDVAHSAGVVHRDLKPGNVLLNLGGRPLEALEASDVKLGDFGLGAGDADTLRSIAQSASLAREDELVGTLAYMAPELRDGREKPSPRSDLYAVGVILFEMLTGERPAGAELPSTLRADVPGALDEVYRRLYARAEARYGSAREVLEDFDARLAPPPLPKADRRGGKEGTCPRCGTRVEAEDQFCTACGQQLVAKVRRCPSCQGYPGPGDRYCIFCGAALPQEV